MNNDSLDLHTLTVPLAHVPAYRLEAVLTKFLLDVIAPLDRREIAELASELYYILPYGEIGETMLRTIAGHLEFRDLREEMAHDAIPENPADCAEI